MMFRLRSSNRSTCFDGVEWVEWFLIPRNLRDYLRLIHQCQRRVLVLKALESVSSNVIWSLSKDTLSLDGGDNSAA